MTHKVLYLRKYGYFAIVTRTWRFATSRDLHKRNLLSSLPKGRSHRRLQAASAPAEAPEILFSNRWGAYFLKQTATPTWYMPRNPQPANERFILVRKRDKLESNRRTPDFEQIPTRTNMSSWWMRCDRQLFSEEGKGALWLVSDVVWFKYKFAQLCNATTRFKEYLNSNVRYVKNKLNTTQI